MPEVHADPEKLKQFAKDLVKGAEQLQQVARELARALERSGWDDAERNRFEQEFKQTLKSLGQFTEKLRGEYGPALLKKASILEQYRGR